MRLTARESFGTVYGAMRKIYIAILTGALLAAACKPETRKPTVAAEPTEAPNTATAQPAAAPGAVGKALSAIPSFNGTPSTRADYYIYLESASWCGPCRAEMPHIVKAYPEMQKQNVELVLIGFDRTKEESEEYLKTFNATFPGVFHTEPGVNELPGYTPASGIPHATFVDRDGKVIDSGHGSMIMKWQEILHR